MRSKTIPREMFRRIRRIQIQTTHLVDDLLGGAYRSVFKGKGMEFEEVREYQSGDEVRHIDWNVTERMNAPFIKSFREERELTVMLVVDISASLRFGSGSQQKKDLVAEIAALLAFSAIKNHDRVGLILFSSELELYLPPKSGVKHVLHVIRELIAFEAKHRQTDLNAALTFLGNVQKQKCICFLLSDFLCPDFHRAAAITAQRHDFTSIAVVDRHEKLFYPLKGFIHMQDLETDEEVWVDGSSQRLQRRYQQDAENHLAALEKNLKTIGGGFIEVEADKPYINLLIKYFQAREKYAP